MSPSSPRILIIDDDEVDREALLRALRKSGLSAETATAATVDEAWRQIESIAFDCILVDYRLPDGDGLELIGQMAAASFNRDTPLILLTGLNDRELALQALRAGAQDFLGKEEIEPLRLERCIRHAMERRALLRRQLDAERGRAAAEARFRQAFHHAGHGIVLLDTEGVIHDVNPAFCRLIAAQDADLPGQAFVESFPVAARERIGQLLDDAFAGRGLVEFTERLLNLRGEEVWGQITVAALQTQETGDSIQRVIQVQDVTARIRAERSLRHREAQLRSVLDHLTDGVLTFDADARLLSVNPAAEQIFAAREPDLVGRSLWQLLANRGQDSLQTDFQQHIKHADRSVFRRTRTMDAVRPNGDTRVCEVNMGDMGDDSTRFLAVVRDVQERLQAEEQFRLLAQFTHDLVCLHDPDGVLRFLSPSVEGLLGYTPDDLVGRTLYDFTHPEDVDQLRHVHLRAVTRGERSKTMTFRARTVAGQEVWLESIAQPVRERDQTVSGFVTASRDVTERRAIEQQLLQAQKMEAVGTLTGGIAHDFNNLLTVIIGSLDLLRDDLADNPQALDDVDGALQAANHGAQLTRQLLAFARRQPLSPASTDVGGLVRQLMGMLPRTLGEQITIELDIAADLSPVLVDASQLESAITNLAINARDAMARGGKLSVALHNVFLDDSTAFAGSEPREPGHYVCISIADSGKGIPAEQLHRIFEPFFTTKSEGTGLGLSMVFGFVRQSRGYVDVYSEPGKGTVFRLYLPVTDDRPDTLTHSVQARHRQSAGVTILAVDDNPIVRATAVAQLRSLGYTVLEAEDADAGLDVLAGHPEVSILFTDLVMPGRANGLDLARMARERHPGLHVIYTSGYPGGSTGEAVVTPPGEVFVAKPYRRADLIAALERLPATGEGVV